MIRTVQSILAWVLVALGAMQWLATPLLFRTAEEPAFWFFGGGITLAMTGALNHLRLAYGPDARALVAVSVGANVILALHWAAMALVLTYKFNRFVAPYAALGLIVTNAAVSLYDVLRRK